MILCKNIQTGKYGFFGEVPDGMINRHSIPYLYKYGIELSDYKYVKDSVLELNGGSLDGLSDAEMYISVKLMTIDSEASVGYLANKFNLSSDEATGLYSRMYMESVAQVGLSIYNRIDSVAMRLLVMSTFGVSDGSVFAVDTIPLRNLARDIGCIGKEYGNYVDGFMDYVESTNTYSGSDSGVNKFGLSDADRETFIASVKDIVLIGKHLFE